jgi:hypothetical protein
LVKQFRVQVDAAGARCGLDLFHAVPDNIVESFRFDDLTNRGAG